MRGTPALESPPAPTVSVGARARQMGQLYYTHKLPLTAAPKERRPPGCQVSPLRGARAVPTPHLTQSTYVKR